MIASRIIEVIKLINNELNKNELVSLILLYEYYREILSNSFRVGPGNSFIYFAQLQNFSFWEKASLISDFE